MNILLHLNKTYLQVLALGLVLAACQTTPIAEVGDAPDLDTAQTSTVAQAGITMQGITMQGMTMQGMRFQGATLAGAALDQVRVERGELVAQRAATTLRGEALVGAHLLADVRNVAVTPAAQAVAEYRITQIRPERAEHDPTRSGHTFLYTLEQWSPDTASWHLACPVDDDGNSVAIPLSATWDERGDRIESTARFTFACTTGVIAKCYRWGYRPWLTGFDQTVDMADMHWACTRLARADYCGNGVPHTRNGTLVNVWDTLPAPGPIQRHGFLPPLGMVFEAGWSTHGAVCLSRSRWLLDDGLDIAAMCPDRLVPLGVGETTCDTVSQALDYDGSPLLFNESYLLNL